jgi:radical SAM-linked protein
VIPMQVEEAPADWRRPEAPEPVARLVVRYAKFGLLRFLSHLELNNVVQRALRRADLPVAMSLGFHPQPKLAFATPLPTGMESHGELMDVTLTAEVSPSDFVARFNAVAPEGLEALEAEAAPLEGKGLMARVVASEYEAHVPYAALDEAGLRARIADFEARESHTVTRKGKNGPKTMDIRPLVERLEVVPNGEGAVLSMRLVDRSGAKGRPDEVLDALLGDEKAACRLRKTATILG